MLILPAFVLAADNPEDEEVGDLEEADATEAETKGGESAAVLDLEDQEAGDIGDAEGTGGLDFGVSRQKLKSWVSWGLLGAGIIFLTIIVVNTIRRARALKKEIKRDEEEDEDQRPRKRKKMDDSGQALVEFIIIFPTILVITTCIIQVAMMKTAKMLVNYAAFNATRSAIVWIPMSISEDTWFFGERDYESPANEIINDFDERNEKMNRIRRAAQLSLLPAGSSHHSFFSTFQVSGYNEEHPGEDEDYSGAYPMFDESGVLDYFPDPVRQAFVGVLFSLGDLVSETTLQAIARRYAYVNFFSKVAFLDRSGNEQEEFTIEQREPLTVEVRLLYHLRIPLANAIIGKHLDYEMAQKIDLDRRSSTGETVVISNITDDQHYYTILSDRSTLLVERKFNHEDFPW